jgi:hypothetical protein
MGGCVSGLCIKNTKESFKSIREITSYEREKYEKKYKQVNLHPIKKLLIR